MYSAVLFFFFGQMKLLFNFHVSKFQPFCISVFISAEHIYNSMYILINYFSSEVFRSHLTINDTKHNITESGI